MVIQFFITRVDALDTGPCRHVIRLHLQMPKTVLKLAKAGASFCHQNKNPVRDKVAMLVLWQFSELSGGSIPPAASGNWKRTEAK